MIHPRRQLARALANAFVSGTWHLRSLMARGDEALGAGGLWLRELAFTVMQRWHEPPRVDLLEDFILTNASFIDACLDRQLPRYALAHPQMGPQRWNVRRLDTVGDVGVWLGLDDAMLSWLADRRGLGRLPGAEPLRHYRRRWIARGERLPRLLEAPKDRLKALQRRVLEDVLAHIPAHDAAHGFVPGRSVLTHARLHAGKELVVRFDLQAFFTNVAAWRALGVFRAAGYTHEVASTLLGLCTTRTPEHVLREAPWVEELPQERFFLQRRLADWHLPQGAPTSPALANLAAYVLDVRLAGLARGKSLTYSRYADDLVFSGPASTGLTALSQQVASIARGEGFRVNVPKTRVMRSSSRQRVTGVVVNEKPNVSRAEFDELKATLHRLGKQGSPGQASAPELRASLQGRVSWVTQLNPARGAKLQRALDALSW